MSNLAQKTDSQIIESVLIEGNLKDLTPDQRLQYYNKLCASLQLNPLTKPFEYIVLNSKLTLYARKDATEQLRKINGVSITKLESIQENGICIVTAYACDKSGRQDVATGAVSIMGARGDALANATMKAETKAKRRVTLSLCGLGMLDESEIETIPQKQLSGAATPLKKQLQLEQLNVEIITSQINDCTSKEMLDSVLERARNSTLIKDKAASQTVKEAKEKCEQRLRDSWLDCEAQAAIPQLPPQEQE